MVEPLQQDLLAYSYAAHQLLCSTAQADADTGQVVFKTRGKEGITKVYRSCSHHHHHRFVASNPPISSDFSGTKCPTAEKTYKL